MSTQRLYLRIGDPPPGERSTNGATGRLERGVSVYAVDWDPGRSLWVVDVPRADDATAVELVRDLIAGDRRAFLVTGRVLSSVGSDGEPLLRSIRIEREVTVRDFMMPGGHHDPADLDDGPDPDDPREQEIRRLIRNRWPDGAPPPWSRTFLDFVAEAERTVYGAQEQAAPAFV